MEEIGFIVIAVNQSFPLGKEFTVYVDIDKISSIVRNTMARQSDLYNEETISQLEVTDDKLAAMLNAVPSFYIITAVSIFHIENGNDWTVVKVGVLTPIKDLLLLSTPVK